MTTYEIVSPLDWQVRQPDELQDEILAEYGHVATSTTEYIVSIIEQPGLETTYKLRLSTVTPAATQRRHDYTVATYESALAAFRGAEKSLHHLTACFESGSLAFEKPPVEDVEAAVEELTDDSAPLLDKVQNWLENRVS